MGDRVYRVYVAVLLTGVVLGPVVWAALAALDAPGVLAALGTPAFWTLALSAVAITALAALLAGRARGPVVLSPFRTHLVAQGPSPRRHSLRGPFWLAAALPVGVGALLAALPVVALARRGEIAGWLVLGAPVLGVLAGVLVAVCWLAGQVSVGAGWRASGTGPSVSGLLDALSGPVLLRQARRWQAATTALGAGEASAAVETYRAVPSTPRPGRALRTRSAGMPLLFLTRDLVAALRTPWRLLAGTVAILLAVVVAGATTLLPGGLWWLAIGVGSGLGYLGLGVLTDGVRHAVEAGAAPVLYGVGDLQLVGLHALLPLAAAGVLGVCGLMLSALLGGASWSAGLGVAALLLAVAVRIYDAAKPPMPLVLQTPMPTAAGDASGVVIALWQVDALLIATVTPVLVGGLVVVHGAGAVVVLPVVAALVLVVAHRRLAAAR
ncbi:hypothetical protein [Ornithinimicrobium sufpigmenti]|uniref:hypothetical protein n=1 Tax=Ornithinimicrobium sufpigmenti TaxID=2508882 RepID=UPI0010369963|nr:MULTISPECIES: hypothetical protein [unclassified Ornithinimicrobium]